MAPCDGGTLGIIGRSHEQRCHPQSQLVASTESGDELSAPSATMGTQSKSGEGLCSSVQFPRTGGRPQALINPSTLGTSSGSHEDQVVDPSREVAQPSVAAAVDADSGAGKGFCTPIQSQDATRTANAPGLAQRTPDIAQCAPSNSSLQELAGTVSPPAVKVLVSSARSKGSVRGERVFRRNAGRVYRLGKETCGPAGLLWTKAAWRGTLEAAMSGLEGLIDAPESALLEGFKRVVASTAAAHLERLREQGSVRVRRAKATSRSLPRCEGQREQQQGSGTEESAAQPQRHISHERSVEEVLTSCSVQPRANMEVQYAREQSENAHEEGESGEGRPRCFVRDLSGKVQRVQLRSAPDVLALKSEIFARIGVPIVDQKLVAMGKQLRNSDPLWRLAGRGDLEVTLNLGLAGGGDDEESRGAHLSQAGGPPAYDSSTSSEDVPIGQRLTSRAAGARRGASERRGATSGSIQTLVAAEGSVGARQKRPAETWRSPRVNAKARLRRLTVSSEDAEGLSAGGSRQEPLQAHSGGRGTEAHSAAAPDGTSPTPLQADEEAELVRLLPAYARLQELWNWTRSEYERCSQDALGGASIETFTWAFANVLSRTFEYRVLLGNPGEEVESTSVLIVPFADMVNHSPHKQLEWSVDASGQWFEMVAIRDIKKEEEVFVRYGRKTNEQWWLYYGYIPPKNFDDRMPLFNTVEEAARLYTESFSAAPKYSSNTEHRNHAIAATLKSAKDVEKGAHLVADTQLTLAEGKSPDRQLHALFSKLWIHLDSEKEIGYACARATSIWSYWKRLECGREATKAADRALATSRVACCRSQD